MEKNQKLVFSFLLLCLFFLLSSSSSLGKGDESKKDSGCQNQESLNEEDEIYSILIPGIPVANSSFFPSKTEWPEVVGLTADVAEEKIKKDMPNARIQVFLICNCVVTSDFRTERVRLFLNSEGTVARTPRIG